MSGAQGPPARPVHSSGSHSDGNAGCSGHWSQTASSLCVLTRPQPGDPTANCRTGAWKRRFTQRPPLRVCLSRALPLRPDFENNPASYSESLAYKQHSFLHITAYASGTSDWGEPAQITV